MYANFNLSYVIPSYRYKKRNGERANDRSSVAAISHRRIFSDMEQAERDGGDRYANKAKVKNSVLSCSPSCENLRSEITDN